MSFANTPVKKYVPWRANKEFIQFFEDMKKRRIAGNSNSPTMRVTNKPPPTNSTKSSTQKSAIKVNYSSPSEIITSSAKALGGSVYKRGQSRKRSTLTPTSSKGRSSQQKSIIKGKRLSKKKTLESKIKNHQF